MPLGFSNLFGGKSQTPVQPAPAPTAPISTTGASAETEAARRQAEALEKTQQLEQERVQTLRNTCKAEFMTLAEVPQRYRFKGDSRAVEDVEADIAANKRAQENLAAKHKAISDRLLTIEATLKHQVDQKQQELNRALNQESTRLQRELARAKLDATYLRIDIEFLKRRKWDAVEQIGLPLFALFSPDHFICQYACGATTYDGTRSWPEVQPKQFAKYCPEPLKTFEASILASLVAGSHAKISMTARFEGGLPDDVRELIKKVTKSFEAVYLVTDAPEWHVCRQSCSYRQHFPQPEKFSAVPEFSNPLIIGELQGHFWLIGSFTRVNPGNFLEAEFADCQPVKRPQ